MEEEEDPVTLFLALDDWQEESLIDQHPSQPYPQSSSETYLMGFVYANIVGLQFYSGTISGREMVGLVREPSNPHDNNAIKVLNTRSVQVGHIERSVAAVLSPLIDSHMIFAEGIVPKTNGNGGRYKIPCQIHVFARFEIFNTVKTAISQGGLVLISTSAASFTLSEAVVVKENSDSSGVKSLDEIFKLVDQNVNKRAKMNAIEPPKEVIKSELFVHQKEGLGWLVHRENSGQLPPFWEEKDGEYVNVLTNYHTDRKPEPLRGGIFADEMGLGKTLTLLSLIAFDRSGSALPCLIDKRSVYVDRGEEIGEGNEGLSVSSCKKGKRGRVSKKVVTGVGKKCRVEDCHMLSNVKGNLVHEFVMPDTVSGPKVTLIVCPPSVFSTWLTQLQDHTRPGKFKVYMYYGERTKEVEELLNYDIVLTTYSTLASEAYEVDSPVKKMEWWRVILDEAHIIKNANAKQSLAVTNLKAKRRWVVTGTPIQNGSFDLFSLMAFLRFEPFSIKSYWQSLVQRPLAQGNKKGLLRLQVLMATISLRRTKDKSLIGLPPKTIETCYVELSVDEREMYDRIEEEAKGVFRNYIDAGRLMQNYSTILSIILRLRQICTDLALCPSDLRSLLFSSNLEDVSNNPELLKKLVAVLQDGEDFDCPICISPPTDIVITCCAHIFCRDCIIKTLHSSKSCCPLCRRPLTQSDLFTAPPESLDTENTNMSSLRNTRSSKVSALLTLLEASRGENPTLKSVVFSQFRKMLKLLEEPLTAAGFKILRLDGSMNATRRAQVIKEFGVGGSDGPTILLASLKASGTGINLTAASRVYLLEPWWNPAVEEQAMDRVHRIGQKLDVKIVRLIARNSIEERILELQERKKSLAREAFGRRGSKYWREVSVDDLRTLMSL
ncbi:SNF2_N domain-containing protein/Helicase_C domain-containing protein/HIRAN domain-containing protein/zf-C3HC4_2 domain-containing protein, partial [Cephalotus follicularis]